MSTAKQVDSISRLISSANPGLVDQGVELALSLNSDAVFNSLLDGVAFDANGPKPRLRPNALFKQHGDNHLAAQIALLTVISASDHPIRNEVTHVSLHHYAGYADLNRELRLSVAWARDLPNLTKLNLDLAFCDVDFVELEGASVENLTDRSPRPGERTGVVQAENAGLPRSCVIQRQRQLAYPRSIGCGPTRQEWHLGPV